jgi:hypothetical protein
MAIIQAWVCAICFSVALVYSFVLMALYVPLRAWDWRFASAYVGALVAAGALFGGGAYCSAVSTVFGPSRSCRAYSWALALLALGFLAALVAVTAYHVSRLERAIKQQQQPPTEE